MKQKLALKEDLLNFIERLSYETLSASNTIATLIETGKDAELLKSVLFMKYEKDYITKFMEYDLTKQQINNIILEDYKDKNVIVNWDLDFATGEITLEVNDVVNTIQETIRIDVDPTKINTLINLYYTVESQRAIITKIFDRNKLNVNALSIYDSEVFKEYQKQLAITERSYEREKETLSSSLIPDKLKSKNINWAFDFYNNQFVIDIKR